MTLFSRRVKSPSPSVQLLSCLFYADMSAILGAVSCQSSSELLQPGGNNTNPPGTTPHFFGPFVERNLAKIRARSTLLGA